MWWKSERCPEVLKKVYGSQSKCFLTGTCMRRRCDGPNYPTQTAANPSLKCFWFRCLVRLGDRKFWELITLPSSTSLSLLSTHTLSAFCFGEISRSWNQNASAISTKQQKRFRTFWQARRFRRRFRILLSETQTKISEVSPISRSRYIFLQSRSCLEILCDLLRPTQPRNDSFLKVVSYHSFETKAQEIRLVSSAELYLLCARPKYMFITNAVVGAMKQMYDGKGHT